MSSRAQVNLRRNGKPQSCEPCRVSKQKCDHSLPICARCVRRNKEPECVYHPSPMTKLSSKVERSNVESPKVPLEQDGVETSQATPGFPVVTGSVESPGGFRASFCGAHPSFLIGSALHVHAPGPEAAKVAADEPDGYLGPTSYAAIFRENKLAGSHEYLDQLPNTLNGENHNNSKPSGRRSPCNLEAPEHIEQGIVVLRHFPPRSLCEALLDRYFMYSYVSLHEPTMRRCLDSIWSTYGEYIDGHENHELLKSMSSDLCKTAMSPILPSTSTEEWVASFSGKRLRWEIVGNFFAIFGLAAMSMSDWDPMFQTQGANKKEYSGEMRTNAEACLGLCNDIDALNEFVISLMENAYSLQSFYEGDSSHQLWRRHGGLASAITAAGFHREADSAYLPGSSQLPSFLVAELRRRLFCMFFSADKQLSTFMGRPPALSRRYSTCKIPLDLTDEEMMATGEELDLIRSRLDSNGWNTSGNISHNTVCRAWANVMVIRDEILELALGPPSDSLAARRDELKQKSEEKYAQMPKAMQYQPEDPEQQTTSAFVFNLQNAFYQEWLLNSFLLDRLPDGGSLKVKQDLINTARKMLDGVLVLSANRDRLKDYVVGFVWAITYSGLPSAAILSVELLRQSKFPAEFRLDLPRSEIIQNLSIFIGCLEWVRPTEGNYTVCVRMRKVIKRILDQVLELPPPNIPPAAVAARPDEAPPPELPISSIFEEGVEPDFLEWLNSVDWTRDMLQDAWT